MASSGHAIITHCFPDGSKLQVCIQTGNNRPESLTQARYLAVEAFTEAMTLYDADIEAVEGVALVIPDEAD